MSLLHLKKKLNIGKRQKKGSIQEDKLENDANQPKICQKSYSIYKITQINQQIQVYIYYLVLYMYLANKQNLEIDKIGASTTMLMQYFFIMYNTRSKAIEQ